MSSSITKNINMTLFGESHGSEIGIVIDGLAPGISIDIDNIKSFLDKRRPDGKTGTSRVEKDEFKIISGIFNGITTGTPLTLIVLNSNTKSTDYKPDLMRPGHADYTANLKYNGFQDYRGGGHFSGRMTTPIVIAGAIASQILAKKGIVIATHIKQINNILDDDFSYENLDKEAEQLNKLNFACINSDSAIKMNDEIIAAKEDLDSVGGILETVILNIEGGIGEPFFDSIESSISTLLFSIPALKGVEFGAGFKFATMRGSDANDAFIYERNKVKTITNNNGGINGGISNGMPIIFRSVIKPTPSIAKTQKTININNQENTEINVCGRHDPCIVQRARIVVDSMTAIAILDLYIKRYGYMWMV